MPAPTRARGGAVYKNAGSTILSPVQIQHMSKVEIITAYELKLSELQRTIQSFEDATRSTAMEPRQG